MMIRHVIYISQYIIECLICVFEPFGHKHSNNTVQIKRSAVTLVLIIKESFLLIIFVLLQYQDQ